MPPSDTVDMIHTSGSFRLNEYATVRTAVSLLALFPMLMPPGMCICQFVPVENVPAVPVSTSSPVTPVAGHAGARRDCSCESCRERRASEGRDEGDARRTPPHDETPSQPGQGKHWPGCPAAVGAAPLTVVLPAVTVHADVDTAVSFTSSVAEPVGSIRHAGEWVSPQAKSPPLFLSHCALLI